MYDVLLLTVWDWANTLYRFTRCLKLIGLNAVVFKGVPHAFNYPEQAIIHPEIMNNIPANKGNPIIAEVPGIKHLIEKAHVVHFGASTFIDTGVDLDSKNVVTQYGGTTYMNDPGGCNSLFMPFTDATIIQFPALLGLGAKNEHLIIYPVDTEFLQPAYGRRDKTLIIGHFPSTAKNKGTKQILKIIAELEADQSLKGRFRYVGVPAVSEAVKQRMDWLEHLERVKQCDVIIECLLPELNGNKWGDWGNAALEAAALGKIVVTNSLYPEVYHREYGSCALRIANNEDALRDQLRELILMDDSKILKLKQQSRAWVVGQHGMKPTADRLWDKVYKDFFKRVWQVRRVG